MLPLSSIYQRFPVENTSENGDHDHDQNANSSNGQDQHIHEHQQYPLPCSNFPTICEDDGLLLSHLLSQQQLIFAGSTISHNSQDEISVVASNQALLDHHHHHRDHHDILHDHHNPSHKKSPSKLEFSKKQRAKVQTVIPRRRTGKKDRHSKISTAQGLRDRRMRLSLQIARKFFDLQDMLGFDKASRTIEWLITKSKTAIKELKDSLAKQSSTSSTSEGEVVSKTAEKEDDDDEDDNYQSLIRNTRKEKRIRKLHNPIARESRDKARARARERTREKFLEKSQKILEKSGQSNADQANNDSSDLGKSRPDDTTRQEVGNPSLKMVALRLDDQEPGDHQLLDYSESNHIGVSEDDFLGFPGNWDIIDNSSSKTQTTFCRNTKPQVIGNVRDQINPCAIFSTTLISSDTEEHKPSSFFPVSNITSNAQRQNPISVFVTSTTSSDTHVEENPSSFFHGDYFYLP